MSGDDGLHDEMRRLLLGELGEDPFAIDQDTADRLLAGRLDPADAPPGYAEVAKVLSAAAAPPSDAELAGEASALTAFRAAARTGSRSDGAGSPSPSWRKTMVSKLVGAKVAVAVASLGVLLVGGTAAAATGSLGAPAQRVVDKVIPGSDRSSEHSATTGQQGKSGDSGQQGDHGQGSGHDGTSTGPDATGAARAGLCTAWFAGEGGTNGGKLDSTAFEALARAAGGADKVEAYCADWRHQGGDSADHRQDGDKGKDENAGGGAGSGGAGNSGGSGDPGAPDDPGGDHSPDQPDQAGGTPSDTRPGDGQP